MVKVLKDNSCKRCVCEFCKSILEYAHEDVTQIKTHPNEYDKVIKCPACGYTTTTSIVPKEGDY